MAESLNPQLIDAFDGIHDPRAHVQWFSALRIAGHLAGGGTIPDDSQSDLINGLKSIADTDSEAHLFSCISLVLLGDTDARSCLSDYLNHDSDTFRINASHVLELHRD